MPRVTPHKCARRTREIAGGPRSLGAALSPHRATPASGSDVPWPGPAANVRVSHAASLKKAAGIRPGPGPRAMGACSVHTPRRESSADPRVRPIGPRLIGPSAGHHQSHHSGTLCRPHIIIIRWLRDHSANPFRTLAAAWGKRDKEALSKPLSSPLRPSPPPALSAWPRGCGAARGRILIITTYTRCRRLQGRKASEDSARRPHAARCNFVY